MSRKQDCKTRYPILLAHGLGVTERGGLYVPWGRVPDVLRAHGAEVCFGGQDAWGSIETGAAQLAETVRKMLRLYGCERVNIIAHSKGGLEARHLISAMGYGKHVASLTMLSTPTAVRVWPSCCCMHGRALRSGRAATTHGGGAAETKTRTRCVRVSSSRLPIWRNLTAPIRMRTAFIIKAGARGWAKTTRMPRCG